MKFHPIGTIIVSVCSIFAIAMTVLIVVGMRWLSPDPFTSASSDYLGDVPAAVAYDPPIFQAEVDELYAEYDNIHIDEFTAVFGTASISGLYRSQIQAEEERELILSQHDQALQETGTGHISDAEAEELRTGEVGYSLIVFSGDESEVRRLVDESRGTEVPYWPPAPSSQFEFVH